MTDDPTRRRQMSCCPVNFGWNILPKFTRFFRQNYRNAKLFRMPSVRQGTWNLWNFQDKIFFPLRSGVASYLCSLRKTPYLTRILTSQQYVIWVATWCELQEYNGVFPVQYISPVFMKKFEKIAIVLDDIFRSSLLMHGSVWSLFVLLLSFFCLPFSSSASSLSSSKSSSSQSLSSYLSPSFPLLASSSLVGLFLYPSISIL